MSVVAKRSAGVASRTLEVFTGRRLRAALFPAWKNTSLFVVGMVGHQLLRLQAANNTITAQEVIFGQFGRVRDIVSELLLYYGRSEAQSFP